MSHAHISKAEIALWGVEHIKKAQKAKSKAFEKGKTKAKHAAHKVVDVVTPDRTSHGSAWKKEVLEGRRKQHGPHRDIQKEEIRRTEIEDALNFSNNVTASVSNIHSPFVIGETLGEE